MTIIMRASWNGYEQGTIQRLSASEEARLVAGRLAVYHVDKPLITDVALVDEYRQIVTRGGDVVGGAQGDGLSANTEDTSSFSIARQIKASAGRVTSILCTTGSAITLTLYDNAAASATGRQIYSGALSAGDVVQPADAWFAQGCYASFTGAAAFVINTSESAQ